VWSRFRPATFVCRRKHLERAVERSRVARAVRAKRGEPELNCEAKSPEGKQGAKRQETGRNKGWSKVIYSRVGKGQMY